MQFKPMSKFCPCGDDSNLFEDIPENRTISRIVLFYNGYFNISVFCMYTYNQGVS